jgi:hypothetical protein
MPYPLKRVSLTAQKKEKLIDFAKPIMIGIIIAITTSLFNFLLFYTQFSFQILDRGYERKIRFCEIASENINTIIELIPSDTKFWFYRDNLYEKWLDSLKVSSLNNLQNEKLFEQIKQLHPTESAKHDSLLHRENMYYTSTIIGKFLFDSIAQRAIVNFNNAIFIETHYKNYSGCRDAYIKTHNLSNLSEVDYIDI